MDGFRFEFPDTGLTIVPFDVKEPESKYYHGRILHSVDFIIETQGVDYYVELKDYTVKDPKKDGESGKEFRKRLMDSLKHKFRDSLLCRFLMDAPERQRRYICLLDTDSALLGPLQQELPHLLPTGPQPNWRYPMLDTCLVMNLKAWNTRFSDWPVTKSKRPE